MCRNRLFSTLLCCSSWLHIVQATHSYWGIAYRSRMMLFTCVVSAYLTPCQPAVIHTLIACLLCTIAPLFM